MVRNLSSNSLQRFGWQENFPSLCSPRKYTSYWISCQPCCFWSVMIIILLLVNNQGCEFIFQGMIDVELFYEQFSRHVISHCFDYYAIVTAYCHPKVWFRTKSSTDLHGKLTFRWSASQKRTAHLGHKYQRNCMKIVSRTVLNIGKQGHVEVNGSSAHQITCCDFISSIRSFWNVNDKINFFRTNPFQHCWIQCIAVKCIVQFFIFNVCWFE